LLFNELLIHGKFEKQSIKNEYDQEEISFDYQIQQKFEQLYNKLFSNQPKETYNYLASLYKNTLYYREESTTIQNILNGFQRMYEQQNIKNDKPNYKHLETNHNNELYQTQRLTWLNNILSKINDINYFNNNGKWVINNLLNFNHQKLINTYYYQKQFKDAIIILQYIGIKYLMPEWNIDKKLNEHFKTFKFRNN